LARDGQSLIKSALLQGAKQSNTFLLGNWLDEEDISPATVGATGDTTILMVKTIWAY
jgi:hypothetical protein